MRCRNLTGSSFEGARIRPTIARMKAFLLCLFILVSCVAFGAKPEPAVGLDQTRKLVEGTIVPTIEFREESIPDIFTHLTKVSRELDPNKTGIVFELSPGAKASETRVTLSLKTVPMIEVLKYVTNLSNLRYRVSATKIVVSQLNEK
jgi:hypothetical protein